MATSTSSAYMPRNGRLDRGRSSSPYGVVASAQFQSGPPMTRIRYSSDDGEVMEIVQEEEWEERKKKTTTTTKNIEKRVQRKLVLEDGEIVDDTGPVIKEDVTENTVTKEVISDENQKPLGQLAIAPSPGDGWIATPGAVIISEKSTKITNSHDEVEDELETEEIQHCGDVTNKEAQDHIRGKSDLRDLIAHRQSKGWELAKPQKRIVYEATRKRGTIDTEDVKENSRVEDGHVVTETERTVRQEQYENESAPDDGSSLSDGSVHEAKKETSHNLVHTKDEDILEYYAVPKGGTLAQGVKLGEGMHVVSEDVHEDRQGDPDEPASEKLRKIRKPSRRDALTRKPLDYGQEEETRKTETNRWLENHFGSESGRSESSYEGSERNNISGGNRITITMSPHPATPEDAVDSTSSPMRQWGTSSPQASSTPKAPPPPPPKPTRIWNSSPYVRSSPEPVNRPSSRLSQDSSHQVQDNELAVARSRLRCTGKNLVEEDKENSAPQSSMRNVKSSNRFQNSSSKYGNTPKLKINDMKDDVVYSSKFRSGKSKRDAPHSPDSPPPPLPSSSPPAGNVGRSQSFHIQTLPWSSSSSSSKKKESTFSKLKKTFKEFRSEERLDDLGKRKVSKKIVYDSRTLGSNIDSRPMWEQQSSWRSKSAWSAPREPTPPPPPREARRKSPSRVTIFSNSFNGREAGTQTGPSPVPPPRTKKKKIRPKSSYFFGQETAACIFTPTNGSRERSFSDNSYKNSSPKYSEEQNYYPTTSHKDVPSYKISKTMLSNDNRFSDREDYYSTTNKSSWTNTVDPRRKPRVVSKEEVRSMTLPKKTRTSTLSYTSPSRKSYMFGESDSANESSGLENHNYRGSMQNMTKLDYNSRGSMQNVTKLDYNSRGSMQNMHQSDYNNRYTPISDRLTNKSSKPVGRSQSFNVQAGSRGNVHSYSTFNGRTLADISGQRTSSTYGSSPYLNLKSPNLISTIARTSSTRLNHLDEQENMNDADEEKRHRFMKGLMNTAPELFHFIHGNGEDETDNGGGSTRHQQPKISPPPPALKPQSSYAPLSVKSPSSSYTAKVFTFGKGENSTLTRTSSQGNDSGFSNSYNSMEENNKKSSETNKRSSYDSSTVESNNKKNTLIDNHNRKSNFNLKTSGGSQLYSPSFRNENEDRRMSRSAGDRSNRLSGEFTGKGHLSTNVREGSPVLIQIKDWNTR